MPQGSKGRQSEGMESNLEPRAYLMTSFKSDSCSQAFPSSSLKSIAANKSRMGAGETWQSIGENQQVFVFQDHESNAIYDPLVYANQELFQLRVEKHKFIMIKTVVKFSQCDGTWTGKAFSRASSRSLGNIDTSCAAYL